MSRDTVRLLNQEGNISLPHKSVKPLQNEILLRLLYIDGQYALIFQELNARKFQKKNNHWKL